MLYPPVSQGIVQEFGHAQGPQLIPIRPRQPVQQIKVDVVCLQPPQLLIEIAVHVPARLYQPAWQLGGQVHLFPVAALEGPTQERLALTVVIGIGGVNIVHAAVNSIPEHPGGMPLIDTAVLADGKAHASKSQYREIG